MGGIAGLQLDRHRFPPRTRMARPTYAALLAAVPPRLAAVARAKLPPRHTVSESILAPGDRKEGLSRAYVQAVASAAG